MVQYGFNDFLCLRFSVVRITENDVDSISSGAAFPLPPRIFLGKAIPTARQT